MDEPAALRTEACGRIKPQPRERTRRMPAGVTGSSRRGSNEIAAARRLNERRRPIDTPILYAWFAAPRDCRADVDAWHDQEHVPIVIQQKDWIAVRRFDIVDGEPESFNRLLPYYPADAAALDPTAHQPASETTWRRRLVAEAWFNGGYKVIKRHGTRQKSVS
jgi:hypothetical protein